MSNKEILVSQKLMWFIVILSVINLFMMVGRASCKEVSRVGTPRFQPTEIDCSSAFKEMERNIQLSAVIMKSNDKTLARAIAYPVGYVCTDKTEAIVMWCLSAETKEDDGSAANVHNCYMAKFKLDDKNELLSSEPLRLTHYSKELIPATKLVLPAKPTDDTKKDK